MFCNFCVLCLLATDFRIPNRKYTMWDITILLLFFLCRKYVQVYANTYFGELVLAGVKFNTLPSTCLSHILWRCEKFQWQFGRIHVFTSATSVGILYEYWWIEVSMNILCPLLFNVLLYTYDFNCISVSYIFCVRFLCFFFRFFFVLLESSVWWYATEERF